MVGLISVPWDLQAAWNSWWECSLLGGNPQGPGVRSKNASSRRFSSAVSSVSGKNRFLTVGLSYLICKNTEIQQMVSKTPLCSKILGPYGPRNQRQQRALVAQPCPWHSSSGPYTEPYTAQGPPPMAPLRKSGGHIPGTGTTTSRPSGEQSSK